MSSIMLIILYVCRICALCNLGLQIKQIHVIAIYIDIKVHTDFQIYIGIFIEL